MGVLPVYQAKHIIEKLFRRRIMLMLKNLGSALAAVAVLSLGAYSAEVAAKPHGHNASRHQPAKKNKLHPACK